MSLIKELIYRLRGEYTTEKLIKMGMKVGDNFGRLNGVILDPSHCWLITIGDNVTLAPRVHVLAHESVILPNVNIGNNVIIGANSTVTKNIPNNSVAVGSPAKVICSLEEYLSKEKKDKELSPYFSEEYTLRKNISMDKKIEMREILKNKKGYID